MSFIANFRAIALLSERGVVPAAGHTNTLGGQCIAVGEDRVARSEDGLYLVGSALPLRDAANLLVEKLDLDAATVRRMTVTNPRKLIGI